MVIDQPPGKRFRIMACDTAGTMLQTFEAIKQAVGLDIPQMLKDVSTGGLVGRRHTKY